MTKKIILILFCIIAISSCGKKTQPKLIFDSSKDKVFAFDTKKVQNRDMLDLLEKSTDKLFRDINFLSRKKNPKVVVGRVYDYCPDFDVPETSLKEALSYKLKNEPLLELSDGKKVDFDYIAKIKVTCADDFYKNHGKIKTFQLTLLFYNLDGLEVGKWSEFIRQNTYDKSWN